MYLLASIIVNTAFAMIYSIEILLFISMILQRIPAAYGKPGTYGVQRLSESFIHPVRAFCGRMGWFKSTPFDVPFMLTLLIIWFTSFLLTMAM